MKVRRFISTFEDIDYTKDQLLNHQNVQGVIIDRRNDFLYHTNFRILMLPVLKNVLYNRYGINSEEKQ